MDHFAGLDVSVKETSVCIVDDLGKIVREVKVASEPEALFLAGFGSGFPLSEETNDQGWRSRSRR